MRIAYLINSLEGGGAQSPLPEILSSLERHGAQVELFALAKKDGGAVPRLLERNVKLHIHDGSLSDHWGAYRWASQAVQSFKPDALITSLTRATLIGQLVGRALKTPVASWQHSADAKPWNRRLLRACRTSSALWIADSQSVALYVADTLKVPPERVMTWPLFTADRTAPQSKEWEPPQCLRIGTMGRLHPSKGYDVLIDALALLERSADDLPVFSVSIAGSGPEEAALRAQAARNGVKSLIFEGFMENPRDYLASQHLYLQPSRREGFCIAMHEAMQAGLPVIASDVGEMPLTIEEGATGWVVPSDDADALAQALRAALRNPPRLGEMGRAGRQNILKRFTAEQFNRCGEEVVSRLRKIA